MICCTAHVKENIINLYASNPSVNNNKQTAINVPSSLICLLRGDATIYLRQRLLSSKFISKYTRKITILGACLINIKE